MNRTKLHSLGDILAIAICAAICGADGWSQVAKFGRCKLKWFETFLELPKGIPSHDTFGRDRLAVGNIPARGGAFRAWQGDHPVAIRPQHPRDLD